MTQAEQVTDHKAEALRLLEWLGDTTIPMSDPRTPVVLAKAGIHSNLAIAEGQERVAQQVQRVADALEAGNLTYADGMVRDAR